ncbi:hypothetical protein CC86DRAFT_426530 [Ophiobolus disseminans]|uniref:Uncharacterized protein n=1 Tax=Ophiobolus disseminans TaxID=1469910 RepID=A0A6A6ZKK5_9PLEO|nr:hypothetical protein CC86DRAFT_426530 [Ophiobolus disseminans]
MPTLYLIVRFDSNNHLQPSYRTHDITLTGLPILLANDETRTVQEYMIIDEEVTNDPRIYRIAVDIDKMAGKTLHISYGTTSRDDALKRLQNIPTFAEESGKERGGDDHNTRARIKWMGQTCVRIKLRESSFCWYELVPVDVEDRATDKAVEEDAEKGRDRKRRKTEVEDAVGKDMDIFEDWEDGNDVDDVDESWDMGGDDVNIAN